MLKRDPTVFVVAGVSLLLYLPGMWWGLPHATHPLGVHSWDVDAVTGLQTLSELGNLFGKPKPDWWVAYPLFHYLVLGLLYAPYLAYLALSGGLSKPSSEFPFGLADPLMTFVNLTLIGRTVTLLMGVGIVVAVYLTAKTVWDKHTGVFAAFVAMLGTPMFYYARTGDLDVPMLFWTILGLLLVAKCLTSGFTIRRAALLGTFAALSVATKDQAYGIWLVGMTVLIIFYLRQERLSRGVAYAHGWYAPVAILISIGFVYALASGLIFAPERFIAHLQFLLNFNHTNPDIYHLAAMRPNTLAGNTRLMLDLFQQLQLAIGPVVLLTALVGSIFSWRSTAFTRLLVAMVLGYIFLVIGLVRDVQYRYVMFMTLVLAFFTARAITLGLNGSRKVKALTVGALVISLAWLIARGSDLTYQMLFDARIAAGEWFEQHCHQGDRVAFFGIPNSLPSLPRGMLAEQMPSDLSAIAILGKEQIRYILVAPDFSSDFGMDRSRSLPEMIYKGLEDESLGYRRVARFETQPLFHGTVLDIPVMSPGYTVNPSIQVFSLPDNNFADNEHKCINGASNKVLF